MKTCHSGGATGSDYIFESESVKKGFNVKSYSFEGHNTKSPNRVILSQDELDECFEHVKIANETLKRNVYNLPTYTKNLIARDWFQVKNSTAVFAVGKIKNEMGIKRQVEGGTGWACQMAIDNDKPLYVFEQNLNKWYMWTKNAEPCDRFILMNYVPELTDNFAGIGTRDINMNGIDAIINLLRI